MITNELFSRIFPTKNLNPRKYNLVRERDELIAALNKFLPRYRIDTYLRICAFFSCCGIETDYFRTTEEYASGADYEGRINLGNVFEGDGRKFKGSSVIQTTGRYNLWRVVVRFIKKLTGKDWSKDERKYEDFSDYLKSDDYDRLLREADRLGVNFLAHPELLRDNIEIAVEAACIFWEENDLKYFADRKQIKQLNSVVNRGTPNKTPLHWDSRSVLYTVCTKKVPTNFCFAEVIDAPPAEPTVEPAVSVPVVVASASAQLTDIGVGQSAPANPEPATDDNFLSNAIDRNVTPDELKTVARASGGRIAFLFSRPFMLLYAALEVGNLWAWGGVIVGLAIIAYLIYAHRADLLKVWNKVKNKFLQ